MMIMPLTCTNPLAALSRLPLGRDTRDAVVPATGPLGAF